MSQQQQQQQQPDATRLILLKSVYFLGGLSGSTWGRFSTIYFNHVLHLSPSQIGIIEAVMVAVRFICTPIWGAIADLCHAKKSVYLFTTFVSSSILLLHAVPTIATGFLPVLYINAGLSAFIASGVLDAHTLEWLAETNNTTMYGQIRLWTAVSWGLGNVLMGYLTDHFAFYYNFILFGVFSLLRIFMVWIVIPTSETVSTRTTKNTDINTAATTTLEDHLLQHNFAHEKDEELLVSIEEQDEKENKHEQQYKQQYEQQQHEHEQEQEQEQEQKNATSTELFAVLCAPSFIFFLAELALIGAALGIVERLLFIYLQTDLQASTFLCGLTVLVTVTFELPIFYYTDVLLKKIGTDGMFIISMVAYVIRAFGYTLLTQETVWYVLFLEVLHGVTFALMWSAAVEFSKSKSPKGWEATVQSICVTSLRCLGMGVGCGVGGWVAETYGFIFLYQGAGTIVGVLCVVHLLMLLFRKIPRGGKGEAMYNTERFNNHLSLGNEKINE